jgi:DNA/RNA-binding domain of Phe-tRNA-synthetase-like protein
MLAFSNELRDLVRMGVLVIDGVTVRDADDTLAREIEEACASLRRRLGAVPSGSVPGVEDARRLYKSLGLDPTKTRPSNEALLRRALKGEPLYRINTAVDAINLCSLTAQLPYGLYDAARVIAPVVLRRGLPGESYEGIRKGPVTLDGRPTLADTSGPFGNPTSDSARTSVGTSTRALLVTVYAPRSLTTERLDTVLDATVGALTRHCGGVCTERQIV